MGTQSANGDTEVPMGTGRRQWRHRGANGDMEVPMGDMEVPVVTWRCQW